MKPADAKGRHRGREAALQMLYQWEIGKTSPADAILTYWANQEDRDEISDAHREFANNLVRGTIARIDEIDRLLSACAQNWRVERMAVLDRIVLRLATYELTTAAETPPKVVINEALELAREYSGEDAVAFVNGVLDAVRKQVERTAAETASRTERGVGAPASEASEGVRGKRRERADQASGDIPPEKK